MMLSLIVMLVIPAAMALPLTTEPMTAGEMAHIMFQDADKDSSGTVSLGELMALFTNFDRNSDGRVGKQEYLVWVRANEPSLVPFYEKLYETFDMDNDHYLDLHDFVNMHLAMDPSGSNYISEWDFIAYWTALFQANQDLHPSIHS